MSHTGRRNADETLAVCVAAGDTVRDAATTAGVSERTARRRMADPHFRDRVAKLRTEMTAQALGRMAARMASAADVLGELLNSDRDSVRLGAARTLIEMGLKLRDTLEVDARITALEEHVAEATEEYP